MLYEERKKTSYKCNMSAIYLALPEIFEHEILHRVVFIFF